MKKISLFLIALAFAVISCNNKKLDVNQLPGKSALLDCVVLTDSLIYGIANRSSENSDSSELAGFNTFLQEEFIDYLFKELYEGKLKAYNFLSEKELSIEEIKRLENAEGFSRSKVGKVQFNEQWLVDKDGNLLKRVNSMTLGVERFSKQGTFVGYNALFKIKFNTIAQ